MTGDEYTARKREIEAMSIVVLRALFKLATESDKQEIQIKAAEAFLKHLTFMQRTGL